MSFLTPKLPQPCPEEVARIIGKILKEGILADRVCAWHNDSERCAIEADHLHNLPSLLIDYQPEKWRWYWRVQRVEYVERSEGLNLSEFETLWKQLEPLIADYIKDE